MKLQEDTRRCVMRYKDGEPPLMICTVLRTAMIDTCVVKNIRKKLEDY